MPNTAVTYCYYLEIQIRLCHKTVKEQNKGGIAYSGLETAVLLRELVGAKQLQVGIIMGT